MRLLDIISDYDCAAGALGAGVACGVVVVVVGGFARPAAEMMPSARRNAVVIASAGTTQTPAGIDDATFMLSKHV